MGITNILIVAGCALGIFIIGKIFLFPIKSILKLVINTIIGGAIIYIINLIGANFGFHIGLNIGTAIFAGILGVPGVVVLVLVRILIGG